MDDPLKCGEYIINMANVLHHKVRPHGVVEFTFAHGETLHLTGDDAREAAKALGEPYPEPVVAVEPVAEAAPE